MTILHYLHGLRVGIAKFLHRVVSVLFFPEPVCFHFQTVHRYAPKNTGNRTGKSIFPMVIFTVTTSIPFTLHMPGHRKIVCGLDRFLYSF